MIIMKNTMTDVPTAILEGQNKPSAHPMDTLLKSYPKVFLRQGEIIETKLLEKQGSRVFFDLGSYGTGIIYGKEYQNAREIIKGLNPGDKAACKVVELENDNGFVELSLKEAGEEMIWKEISEYQTSKESLDLEITDSNKGGLVIDWKGVKGFLPASQLKSSHYPRVEGGDKEKILEELNKLVGETLSVIVLDTDPKSGKLIFSEKGSGSDELKVIVEKYKVGDEVEGEVTGVVDFGIFIKIEEGLEGLAHVSELDWALVEDPRNLFKVGERIKAKIIAIEGDKVSLSVKALKEDPWQACKDKYKKGDIVEGKILRFNKFGVLTMLDSGIYGLCHISEFGTENKMKEIFILGDTYVFQIMVYQPENKKLSLSYLGKPGEPNKPKEEIKEEKTEAKAEPASPDLNQGGEKPAEAAPKES